MNLKMFKKDRFEYGDIFHIYHIQFKNICFSILKKSICHNFYLFIFHFFAPSLFIFDTMVTL